MFPDFHYLFLKLFHIDLPFLSIIKTFGFCVAMAFIAGARVLQKELKRKTDQGLLHPFVGKDKKTGQPVKIYPFQMVADMVMVAVVGGFAGAKIFNAFETWQDFLADPIGNLISPRGLTFYGGLIVAAIALYFFARKKKIGFRYLCDAAAPALILAYGLGRLGCQLSGDGDWGIYNSAYTTAPETTQLRPGTEADFDSTVHRYYTYFGAPAADVPHKFVPAPAGLPVWLFAMNFPNNVNNDGIAIPGQEQQTYNSVLPAGVFPTSLYESVACVLFFFLLWGIRKRLPYPLQMFGIYLIVNGVERFLVEQIRVNYKYDWGFIHPTQAEIISVCLIVAGAGLYVWSVRNGKRQEALRTA